MNAFRVSAAGVRDEMDTLMTRALEILPPENRWINPDSGLKARSWAEVCPALVNLVACAHALRARLAPTGAVVS